MIHEPILASVADGRHHHFATFSAATFETLDSTQCLFLSVVRYLILFHSSNHENNGGNSSIQNLAFQCWWTTGSLSWWLSSNPEIEGFFMVSRHDGKHGIGECSGNGQPIIVVIVFFPYFIHFLAYRVIAFPTIRVNMTQSPTLLIPCPLPVGINLFFGICYLDPMLWCNHSFVWAKCSWTIPRLVQENSFPFMKNNKYFIEREDLGSFFRRGARRLWLIRCTTNFVVWSIINIHRPYCINVVLLLLIRLD